MNWQIPSPIQKIESSELITAGVELWLKREDLIHPIINGNKYRKLKYNLEYFEEEGFDTLVTFGGAFSNHIHAVASAGKQFGINTVGIIRGEYDENNPTLQYAQSFGMKLHFVSRTAYRQKENADEVKAILQDYPNAYMLPEGGTNSLALKGTKEISQEINAQMDSVTHICVSAGTGGTAAGMIQGTNAEQEVLVFSSLKGDFLKADISDLSGQDHFELITAYHFGGYGRTNAELISFINQFHEKYNVILDPIYNGKGIFGLMDLIAKGHFPKGSQIIWVLTGGQQGNTAWNYRHGGGLVQ